MSHLTLSFLGQFQVSRDGQAINAFGSEKAQALLAYLATDTRVHQRNVLTALLWPNYRDDSARTNLRQALHRLRHAIGEDNSDSGVGQANPPLILSTRETLQLNPESSHEVDVRQFTTLVQQCEQHVHSQVDPTLPCVECLERMSAAVERYRGEFLEGFTVADSLPFEEWRRLTQERLHLQVVDLLQQLTEGYSVLGQHGRAYGFVSRWVNLEPYGEAANRQMMTTLVARGDRNAALEHFQSYRLLLASELKIEPQADTVALYESIRAQKANRTLNAVPTTAPISKASRDSQSEKPNDHEAPHGSAIVSIPVLSAELIGRSEVLRQLATLLERPECRLLTLHGPPGVGKTRLAIDLARRQQTTLNISVCFVELAAFTDPELVLPTVARSLGINVDSGRPILDVLAENLRALDLLLVLDNFEQVMMAAEGLDRLLSRCSRLKIVITSRVLLHIRAEQRFAVDPLQVSDAYDRLDFNALSQLSAVQLFLQRAQQVKPDFALVPANAAQVAELCLYLDGLPLAIELAAARIRVLPISAILARMRHPLQFLHNATRLYSTRQKTLSNAIAWSYALLSEPLQCLFRRLAVFVDGFTLESAEAVCRLDASIDGISTGDVADVLEGIESLLDHSLLHPQQSAKPAWADTKNGDNDHDDDIDVMRFRMLESIRAYAKEQLEANLAEVDAARRRHVQFFLALAEQAEPQLHLNEQMRWLKRLDIEHNNILSAIDWLNSEGDVADELRLVTAMSYFWYARGYLNEGLRLMQRALARAHEKSHGLYQGMALNAAGYFLHVLGQSSEACKLFEHALVIGRERADKAVVAFALQYLGVINPWHDDTRAITSLEESLALYRELQRPFYIANTLVRLGNILLTREDVARAQRCYEESLTLLRQTDDRLALPFAMRHLAYLLVRKGDLSQAVELGAESVRRNLLVDDQIGAAAGLVVLAIVARARQQLLLAVRLLGAVDAGVEAIGTPLLMFDQINIDQLRTALSTELADEAFIVAYAEGRLLTTEDALLLGGGPEDS